MHGTMVVVVMMTCPGQVVDLVCNVERPTLRMPAALHCKSMQGNKQHQENAEKTAHGL